MKITDIAFAATLSAILLGSLAALAGPGRFAMEADRGIPVLRLETVVITGTKASARPLRSHLATEETSAQLSTPAACADDEAV